MMASLVVVFMCVVCDTVSVLVVMMCVHVCECVYIQQEKHSVAPELWF